MPDNIEKVAYPALGPDGWIHSSMRQADMLMADFLAVDRSQSYVFSDFITSFGWIIAEYSGAKEEMMIQMRDSLKSYFERYFNDVVVECYENTKTSTPSKFHLSLYVEFQMADGSTGNIYRLTEINGSKFEILRTLTTDRNS